MAQLRKGTIAGRHKAGAALSALALGLLHASYLPRAAAGNTNQFVQGEMAQAFCSTGAELPFSLQTGQGDGDEQGCWPPPADEGD